MTTGTLVGLCADDAPMDITDTAVAPAVATVVGGLAWSAEPLCEPTDHAVAGSWWLVWRAAAIELLAGLVVAVAVGAAGWAWLGMDDSSIYLPPVVVTAPVPPAPVPESNPRDDRNPIPPTWANTATIKHLATPIGTPAADQRILDTLREWGYTIGNPAAVLANAHQACQQLRDGQDPVQVDDQLAARTGADWSQAVALVSAVQLSGAKCIPSR